MPKIKTHSGAKKRFKMSKRQTDPCPCQQISHPDQEEHKAQEKPAQNERGGHHEPEAD